MPFQLPHVRIVSEDLVNFCSLYRSEPSIMGIKSGRLGIHWMTMSHVVADDLQATIAVLHGKTAATANFGGVLVTSTNRFTSSRAVMNADITKFFVSTK